MNRQDQWKDGKRVSRGIEWTAVWGRPGYTSNPVKGCLHDCKWEMPNGEVSECYAKTVAENLAQKAYPNGFAHIQYDPKAVNAWRSLKEPSGIFVDSMSDLFGKDVDRDYISGVLDVMRETPQHVYFILTKNPPKLLEFAEQFPANAWVGVSAPPTFMFGKRLDEAQQQRWYDRALSALSEIPVPVRWTSIEPLSWDVTPVLSNNKGAVQWAVIGAASMGRRYFAPSREVLGRVLKELDRQYVPVFFKGNLSVMNLSANEWREEFPKPY